MHVFEYVVDIGSSRFLKNPYRFLRRLRCKSSVTESVRDETDQSALTLANTEAVAAKFLARHRSPDHPPRDFVARTERDLRAADPCVDSSPLSGRGIDGK